MLTREREKVSTRGALYVYQEIHYENMEDRLKSD